MSMCRKLTPKLNNQTMDETISLIKKVIDKGYDKETLRISSYWDLRDDINFFWNFVERAKEIGMDKFKEIYGEEK